MKGSGYPGYCGGKFTESQCTWSTNTCKSGQVGGKNNKKKKIKSKKKGGNNNLLYNGYCGVTGPENQHLISQCTYNLPCGPSVTFRGGNRSKKKYNKKGGDIFTTAAKMLGIPDGLTFDTSELKDIENEIYAATKKIFNDTIEKKKEEVNKKAEEEAKKKAEEEEKEKAEKEAKQEAAELEERERKAQNELNAVKKARADKLLAKSNVKSTTPESVNTSATTSSLGFPSNPPTSYT